MNTPAHLIVGTAAFARPGMPAVTTCAILGALAPDLSLYLMAGVSLFLLGLSPNVVFGQLYYSDTWQAVFAIDNSFVIWGALFAFAIRANRPAVIALAGAALLHLALDFPLHTHDARMHFWPVSSWVFESPVSYWDSRAYGNIVAAVALGGSLALCVLIWRRFQGWRMRAGVTLMGAAEAMSSGFWRLFF